VAERFSAEGAVVALNRVNDGEAAAQAVAASTHPPEGL
jgi:hypothetical protein